MVFQHRFSGQLSGGDSYMFTWWATSGSDIDTVHAAANTWANAFWDGGGYEAHVAPSVTLTNVTTVQVTDATGLQTLRRDSAHSLAGVNVTGSLPADVALVVSLRTAQSNRSGRGRFYLPQPAVDQLDESNGRVSGAAVSSILTALQTAWGGYTPTGIPVVYSRTLRATQPVVSYDMGDLFDTQRRRESSMLEARQSLVMT